MDRVRFRDAHQQIRKAWTLGGIKPPGLFDWYYDGGRPAVLCDRRRFTMLCRFDDCGKRRLGLPQR